MYKNLLISTLKYGGLSMSGVLTLMLFSDLFWGTPFGLLLIVFALVLFEVGAALWNKILEFSKEFQRPIAAFCMSFCVAASVLSSVSEIVLVTKWFNAGIDVAFWTLMLIGAALAVNIVGIIAFDYFDPVKLRLHREANRDAMYAMTSADKVDAIWKEADELADREVDQRKGDIARRIAEERVADVIRKALESTPGGKNTSSGQQPKQRFPQSQMQPKPQPQQEPVIQTMQEIVSMLREEEDDNAPIPNSPNAAFPAHRTFPNDGRGAPPTRPPFPPRTGGR